MTLRAFPTPCLPPHMQVSPGVMPRLQQGWYYALTDPQAASACSSGCAVCLVAHTPSSASSTRITMVYTPPEHRGRGHAKVAGERPAQEWLWAQLEASVAPLKLEQAFILWGLQVCVCEPSLPSMSAKGSW